MMSHISDMELRIRDTAALAEAAQLCGLEFREGQKSFRWFGRFVGDSTPPAGRDPKDYGTCEHALAIPGDREAYEAGLVAALDGDGYDILCDTWGPGRKTAARLDKLRQEYAVAVTLKAARSKLARQGYTAAREDLPNGRVRVRLVRRGR